MVSIKSIMVRGLFLLILSVNLLFIYSQDNFGEDKEALVNLINSPKTKQLLATEYQFPPSVVFDMGTLALDRFRSNIVVATLDFEHTPSGKHGTASIAHKKTPSGWEIIYSSYWLWGTVVSGTISSDTTWNEAGSPYYVTDDISIAEGATLTITPNTVVRIRKFDTTNKIVIAVDGTLNCQDAVFTTSCDFENYDLSQLTWNDADWDGISFWITSAGAILGSLIEYAGNGSSITSESSVNISNNTIKRCVTGVGLDTYVSAGIHIVEDNLIEDCGDGVECLYQTSSTSISGNTIIMGSRWSGSNGIFCFDSPVNITSNVISNYDFGIKIALCSPNITSNSIQNNTYGIDSYAGVPYINNNNIEGNSTYGLYHDGLGLIVYAENNWWGDASGPYHPALNPSGLGNEVSDDVDFDPWMTSAVTMTFSN